jgi:hypothetical protein
MSEECAERRKKPRGPNVRTRISGALRAAEAAGRKVHRVVIERDGKIVLVMDTDPLGAEPVADHSIVL